MWTCSCGTPSVFKVLTNIWLHYIFRDFSCYNVAYRRNICELTDASGLHNLRELSLKPVASLPARIEHLFMAS